MATTATLGSITFNAKTTDPYYLMQRLDGWMSPPTRTQPIGRISTAGSVIVESQTDHRTLSLDGFIVASTNTLAWSGLNTLESVLDIVDVDGTFVVNEPTPKQVTVRRAGPVRHKFLSQRIIEWSVELIAADPTKFSTTLDSETTS